MNSDTHGYYLEDDKCPLSSPYSIRKTAVNKKTPSMKRMRIFTGLLTDSNWHDDKEDGEPAVAGNAWRFGVVVREAAVQTLNKPLRLIDQRFCGFYNKSPVKNTSS